MEETLSILVLVIQVIAGWVLVFLGYKWLKKNIFNAPKVSFKRVSRQETNLDRPLVPSVFDVRFHLSKIAEKFNQTAIDDEQAIVEFFDMGNLQVPEWLELVSGESAFPAINKGPDRIKFFYQHHPKRLSSIDDCKDLVRSCADAYVSGQRQLSRKSPGDYDRLLAMPPGAIAKPYIMDFHKRRSNVKLPKAHSEQFYDAEDVYLIRSSRNDQHSFRIAVKPSGTIKSAGQE